MFLTFFSLIVMTVLYLRVDDGITTYLTDGESIVRERSVLFERFGFVFFTIATAFIVGNVAQKHRAFHQYEPPDPNKQSNEED
jgi:hypothetical protein